MNRALIASAALAITVYASAPLGAQSRAPIEGSVGETELGLLRHYYLKRAA